MGFAQGSTHPTNCKDISDVIPGMNAIAFTREVRALASLEGWCSALCLRYILRDGADAPPQDDGGKCALSLIGAFAHPMPL